MLHYLLLGLPTGLLVGGFGGILICGIFECKRLASNIIIAISIITMTIIGGLCFKHDITEWNSGYCVKCGSLYELKAVSGSGSLKTRYYQCTNDKCLYEITR